MDWELLGGWFFKENMSKKYALMYEEMTGDKVDQIVILISADDETIIPYVEQKADHIEQLKLVIEDYRQRKNLDFQKD